MKNRLCSVLIGVMMLTLVGCGTGNESSDSAQSDASNSSDSAVEASADKATDETNMRGESKAMREGEVTVVGQVVSVVGNMVKIQVGSYAKEFEAGVGERPEGMMEGEMPEGMEAGERPEGMMEGEMPEGMEAGERPEGMTRGGMQGGMSGIEAVDMSEFIELTDEVVEITIPVGTPVYSKAVEYEFTDIVEDCYITISENENGTIVAVNILG